MTAVVESQVISGKAECKKSPAHSCISVSRMCYSKQNYEYNYYVNIKPLQLFYQFHIVLNQIGNT